MLQNSNEGTVGAKVNGSIITTRLDHPSSESMTGTRSILVDETGGNNYEDDEANISDNDSNEEHEMDDINEFDDFEIQIPPNGRSLGKSTFAI
jgi:hypothetical protein